MDTFSNVGLGLAIAFTPINLLYCFIGVFLGTLIGVIPGLGALTAISLLLPLTFYLEPTTALIMLAGIWYGTSYGGSTTSILLNVPGTPSSAIATLDGHPMAKAGRGGVALFITTLASFVGGTFGVILLMLFSPIILQYALGFGSPEYFALMILGLVAASTISDGSAAKGLAMVCVGIAFGIVGTDLYTGVARYTFRLPELLDGVSLVALAMGLFGVGEMISSIGTVKGGMIDRKSVTLKSMIPTATDLKQSALPIVRGSLLGSFFGTMPGTGPSVASFISYAVEKQVAREPQRFGKGAIEGVAAPEAANNAADQTAFIPTLTLGIPGSATMALMLGVLMIHGIAPGPGLMSDRPDLFWGLIMSFWIGNVLLVLLNIPLIGIWVRMLLVPYGILFPAVLMFIAVGAFAYANNIAEVWVVLFFGVFGYLLKFFDMPPAPLLLGFVLGPMMEEHFRRSMLFARGDFAIFLDRPVSATVLGFAALLLAWSLWRGVRGLYVRKARA